MKNLAFIGNSEPPGKLLNIFRKFTHGKSGVWGQLRGVDNLASADYYAVIDELPIYLNRQVDSKKCIFLGAHPPGMPPYRDMSNYQAFKTFDCSHTFGFGEWWLKYDYDYLSALQPPVKTGDLAAIMSNTDADEYHKMRRAYLERFCQLHGPKINVYGRIQPFGAIVDRYHGACGSYDPRGAASAGGNDHMSGKEDVYQNHRYAMEFDAPAKYYFSERVFDCLLMWCMPIYWGCDHLQDFIHHGSFSRLDVGREGADVIDVIDSNVYERALPYIGEARQALLNKLHIWPRVHEAIFGTTS